MSPFRPDVSVGIALAAGFVSFLSPCVLPLVPAYIGYLSGRAVQSPHQGPARRNTMLHAAAFVLGFSLIFILLGLAASGVGRLLGEYRAIIARLGGLVIIVFALNMLGLFKIPALAADYRWHRLPRPEWGYLSSALLGVFFGVGWSPCIGPTLGAILTLALDEATLARGGMLLLAYSLGLGIPFLLLGLSLGRVGGLLQRARKAAQVITYVSGVFLLVLGILMLFDRFYWVARLMPGLSLDL